MFLNQSRNSSVDEFVTIPRISRFQRQCAPDIMGRQPTSLAAFLPGTNRTSFDILPIVMYNSQALCLAFPERSVLSDVRMIGIMVAVLVSPSAFRMLVTSS